MALLTVSGLTKEERGKAIVKDINFTQPVFQKIAVAGETGSGKTTLLKMIAGLIQPDAGEIRFENRRVAGPYEKLIPGHPGIAYLSQHFELRNNYRVEEELEAVNKWTDKEAGDLYAVCRIEHLLKRKNRSTFRGRKTTYCVGKVINFGPQAIIT